MAGLVPAISVGEAAAFPIEMAGTRPAMTDVDDFRKGLAKREKVRTPHGNKVN